MRPDPIANDARRARRARRLPRDARCLTCGTDNPVVLTTTTGTGAGKAVVKSSERVEEHHIAGWQVDNDLVAAQCLNCHAVRHENLRDLGVDLYKPGTNVLEQLLTWLAGIGEFLHGLGESAHRLATQLQGLLDALDQTHTDWRQLPQAAA